MQRNAPSYVKERLSYEAERLRRLQKDYPYSRSEAISKLKEELEGFEEKELDAWEEMGLVDERQINGEQRFFASFVDNLLFRRELGLKKKLKVTDHSRNIVNESVLRILKGEKKTYRVTASIHIRVKKPGRYRVWLPVPIENDQIENVKILRTEPGEGILSWGPQRTIYVEGNNQDFDVEFQYDVSEWRPGEAASTPPPADYLSEKLPHVRFTPFLRRLTAEVIEGAPDQRDKALKIYRWITENVDYAYVPEYCLIDNISEYAAINGRGDCGVQALLFITMCRIAGIPAKWQSGWFISPVRTSPHDWAQVYVDGGWIPVDPSFGGSRKTDDRLRGFYFGGLDGFRMTANEDFQTELFPRKTYPRSDPVDNQRGEVENETRNLYYDEFDWSIQVKGFQALRSAII